MSSLAERIATVFPYPGVAIKIKDDDSGLGYDIHFVFQSLGIQATRNTSSLNLSNRSMQDIVDSVVDSFEEMLDEAKQEQAAH